MTFKITKHLHSNWMLKCRFLLNANSVWKHFYFTVKCVTLKYPVKEHLSNAATIWYVIILVNSLVSDFWFTLLEKNKKIEQQINETDESLLEKIEQKKKTDYEKLFQ